jgi:hypothetical protein
MFPDFTHHFADILRDPEADEDEKAPQPSSRTDDATIVRLSDSDIRYVFTLHVALFSGACISHDAKFFIIDVLYLQVEQPLPHRRS